MLCLLTLLLALQDVKRCLNALEQLGTLQVTSQILQKNTDVVATLKKVCGSPGQKGLVAGGAQGCSGRPASRPSPGLTRKGVMGWWVEEWEGPWGHPWGWQLGRGSQVAGRPAAPPEPGLSGGQIRRYKANQEVMEKAAEVYTRLKSRVLGPKIEAIQKVTRTGAEKERAEVEKAEEALAGEETPVERAEDQANAGEGPAGHPGPEQSSALS